MSLRKLFENASASEFLGDIYLALLDVKRKNNEHYIALRCIECTFWQKPRLFLEY